MLVLEISPKQFRIPRTRLLDQPPILHRVPIQPVPSGNSRHSRRFGEENLPEQGSDPALY